MRLHKYGFLFPVIFNKETRQKIDGEISLIKDKYCKDGKVSEETLTKVSEDRGIKIIRCYEVIIPGANRRSKEPYLILPDYKNLSNLAHELGHIILDTSSEREVCYFERRLLGNYVKHYVASALKIFAHTILLHRRYSKYPELLDLKFDDKKRMYDDEEIKKDLEYLLKETKDILRI